ncbi:Uncharacterised protein [Vibrio cholerae]|nr:Uncharacterised protein [Vibrio cholerae]
MWQQNAQGCDGQSQHNQQADQQPHKDPPEAGYCRNHPMPYLHHHNIKLLLVVEWFCLNSHFFTNEHFQLRQGM